MSSTEYDYLYKGTCNIINNRSSGHMSINYILAMHVIIMIIVSHDILNYYSGKPEMKS